MKQPFGVYSSRVDITIVFGLDPPVLSLSLQKTNQESDALWPPAFASLVAIAGRAQHLLGIGRGLAFEKRRGVLRPGDVHGDLIWWFFATPLKNDGVRQLG